MHASCLIRTSGSSHFNGTCYASALVVLHFLVMLDARTKSLCDSRKD